MIRRYPFDGGHENQADACVAAGGLDYGVPRFELAITLSRLNHRPGDAVFNAARWVKGL